MRNIFINLKFSLIIFLFIFAFGLFNVVHAEEGCDPCTQSCTLENGQPEVCNKTNTTNGIRSADVKLKNPLKNLDPTSNPEDISKLVGLIIKALMGFIGAVVLLLFVMGAFKWLTSQGNSEKVAEGTKTMAFAMLGALVVFLSYMLAELIIGIITGTV